MIFRSPTEQSPHLTTLGPTSPLCESNGCDFLSISPTARVGFQRKEINDFFNSLVDGRLQKELAQIEASLILTQAVLIIEGPISFTTEGSLLSTSYSQVTRAQLRSIEAGIQLRSIVVVHTDSTKDTASAITSLAIYFGKANHTALDRRPKVSSGWGRTTTRAFASHLLQSFPAVGPQVADRIYQHFGGVPIAWTCTAEDLMAVPGIGRRTAERLIAALAPIPMDTASIPHASDRS